MKTQTHGGDSHIKTEAEIRVMLPESQEHQKPPEFERGKEKSSCAFKVSMVVLTPPFLTSPELKKLISSVISHPVCGNLAWQP